MANTRFCAPGDNQVLRYTAAATYPRVINGLGAGTQYPSAPALVEDAQYPMANIHVPDRYTPWATPSGTTPASFKLHVDLGSNLSVGLVAVLGFRMLGSSTTPNVTFRYLLGNATSPTFGYSTTGFASNVAGTVDLTGRRDAGLVVGPITARYWEMEVAGSVGGYAFGGIYLGAIAQDLGLLYSPGMDERVIYPVMRGRTGGGHPSVMTVGDTRRLIRMPFENVDDTIRTKLDILFGDGSRRDPAIWLDRAPVGLPTRPEVRQVILSDDSISWRHNWDTPNLWSTELELEVLG